jgi:hypothetical protein
VRRLGSDSKIMVEKKGRSQYPKIELAPLGISHGPFQISHTKIRTISSIANVDVAWW